LTKLQARRKQRKNITIRYRAKLNHGAQASKKGTPKELLIKVK
jgi:hypothetical protein